jgi:alanyl-tRNA synthetase
MDIRKEFLDFFASKNHHVYSSMQLIPDDPTLLFTNAGMVQFKDIFTGATPIPSNPRAASCQLCVRAGGKHNDLENVGYTARHHTLFEMLGNFSFGDYFKKDAIAFAWEFITEIIKLPKEKLYVTVHQNDEEAYELWQTHIQKERIYKLGDKDNFWSMGDTGACGPCSEIFYDQGSENFNGPEDYMGGDGDRFLEIWNLVFMQFERSKDGQLKPLPKPSIDTGMGLERITAIKEGKFNNFDSSIFAPIIKAISNLLNKKPDATTIASFRVAADHLRAVSFMLSHGVLFDKEGRGYVLRRILRRAVRHGYLLGFKSAFLHKLVDSLIESFGGHYSEIIEKRNYIIEQIKLEEERFFHTIASGMELFNAELANTKEIFSGDIAFKLYDTYGFPLDLTEDMLRDQNLSVDNARFNELMKNQKASSKASWKGSGDNAKSGDFKNLLELYGKNNFVGYTTTDKTTKTVALLDENFKITNKLQSGQNGWIMLEQTPFYAESGGQCGDSGAISNQNMEANVKDTKKFFDLNLSEIEMINGELNTGDEVLANVYLRAEIEKHHSATHLLQAALRTVLGENIAQAGSSNNAQRLRFDFTYPKAMTKEQLEKVELIVNQMIANAIEGNIEELPIEQAKQKGAIAMFGEKYGNVVRVVSFGDASVEFCGGTHTKNTSQIGSFYIIKESGVSAGVRRIEAVCSLAAVNYAKNFMNELNTIKDELKSNDTIGSIKKLKDQIKELKNEIKNSKNGTKQNFDFEVINGTKVAVALVENGDIKELVDDAKNAYESVALFLFQINSDKVMMASGVKNAKIKAGEWIKTIAPIVGGGGGGRPDFAQAGGKDASRIQEAIQSALDYARKGLS